MVSQPSDNTERCHVSGAAAVQEVLHFRVSGMQLCVPLDYVSKVLPLMSLQIIPGAPAYLRGLMNLHGMGIPVIDLGERLGQKNSRKYTLDTPMLLCAAGARRMGLIISEILEVNTIDHRDSQMSDVLADSALPFLAVFNTEQGLSCMLDLQMVMDIDVGGEGTELCVDPETLMKQLA